MIKPNDLKTRDKDETINLSAFWPLLCQMIRPVFFKRDSKVLINCYLSYIFAKPCGAILKFIPFFFQVYFRKRDIVPHVLLSNTEVRSLLRLRQ